MHHATNAKDATKEDTRNESADLSSLLFSLRPLRSLRDALLGSGTFRLRHRAIFSVSLDMPKPNHWMVKQEPGAYSWDDFVHDGKTKWTGVRNFQARNNLKAMRKGDRVLFYHSVAGKEVVGIAEVTREAFADPTATDGGNWVCVELAPKRALRHPVTLDQIKAEPPLKNIPLLKQSRLSVLPLTKQEFDTILALASPAERDAPAGRK
jgi:predicted RNA-binding protein with PUA-like domain